MATSEVAKRSMTAARDALAAIRRDTDEESRFARIAEFVSGDPHVVATEATRLLASQAAQDRALGADLLGQLGTINRDAAAKGLAGLVAALQDSDSSVISSAVIALGHLAEKVAKQEVLALTNHPDSSVRFATAFTLPRLGYDETVLRALRSLSRDEDSDVRDWATFALAESPATDDQTRAALWDRANDADSDTRAEAIYGLAKRGERQVAPLIKFERRDRAGGTLLALAEKELRQHSRAGRRRQNGLRVFRDSAGRWRWRFVAPSGQVIATSVETFRTRAEARRAFDDYRDQFKAATNS